MQINPSIAVIDGDTSFGEDLTSLLRARDFIAKTFSAAEDFLASARLSLTTCVIAEMRLPGMSGLELYGQLVARGTPIPTILMAAHREEQTRSRALSAGVAVFLTKPFGENELPESIRLGTGRGAVHAPATR